MSGLFAALALTAVQAHTECWLQYKGWLNSGTNPTVSQVKTKMQALATQYNLPWEILPPVGYQESGIKQYASDGKLLHNVTECKKNYKKWVLGMSVSAPTPPGLGMMQLTGSTATGQEAAPYTQIRTSWQYNLEAGVKVLINKWNAYVGSTATPSFLVDQLNSNRQVIENWYIPLWRYNGYVGNYGTYPKKIWSELKNRPGILLQYLPASIPATHPDAVIAHFFNSALGEAYVARSNGTWTCKHGYNYNGAVHLSSGAAPPPPPLAPTPVNLHLSVTAAVLNVRSGPGTTYSILGTVATGQRYFAFQQQGAWYRIYFNGAGGWCSSAYLASATGNSTQITVAQLAVRNSPSMSAAVAGSVYNGQKYGVSGTSGVWLQIYWGGGQYWVDSTYTSTPVLPPPPAFPKLKLVTVGTLNVRGGPSTSYAILGTILQNQRYVATGQSGNWFQIYFNGGMGWVYGGYTTSSSGTCVKVNTTTLNVRTGPGTTYSIAGTVSQGQLYFRAATSGGWSRIHWAGSTERWCSSSYVLTITLN